MIQLYGSRISYYAGKLETYLRYRGLPYEMVAFVAHQEEIRANAGAVQSPVVKLDDGRWLSDTTPMIAWFESQQDGPSIYPEDPALRFAALLIEDHADEWLWRPAMHYRWSYRKDRDHASGWLVDELMTHMRGPRFLKRRAIARRQLTGFVTNDGVDETTRPHVEATAMAAYDQLEAVFAERPFLLGERPTIADYGFVGPMLRHFAQDPTPAELMRQRAPKAFAWVARMWEGHSLPKHGALVPAVDALVEAILREACETHLVQLRENAAAWARGATHFAMEVQGTRYAKLPVSRYRLWCLEELRREWQALDAGAQDALHPHLVGPGADVLWEKEPEARSEYDPERRAPFNRAINVFTDGVPR